MFNCEKCKLSIDRDLNASLNLMKLAVSSTVTQACGEVKQVSNYGNNLDEAGIKQQTEYIMCKFV